MEEENLTPCGFFNRCDKNWVLDLGFIYKFPASRVISLGPVRQRSTSPGRTLLGLGRTQYRFGVQKRHGSFRMGRESNPDGGCHHRPVLPLGLPRPDISLSFVSSV
ncbi:hypothetical protein YC2023_010655 [Brassica napus]